MGFGTSSLLNKGQYILPVYFADYTERRSYHRTNYAQVSIGCLDFKDHYHQLKSNFIKDLPGLFLLQLLSTQT